MMKVRPAPWYKKWKQAEGEFLEEEKEVSPPQRSPYSGPNGQVQKKTQYNPHICPRGCQQEVWGDEEEHLQSCPGELEYRLRAIKYSQSEARKAERPLNFVLYEEDALGRGKIESIHCFKYGEGVTSNPNPPQPKRKPRRET